MNNPMNSKTNKALFTWLGTNDLKDTQRTEEESYGAITSILKDSNIIFNHIVILSNRKNKEVEDYLVWLNSYIKNKRLSTKVDIHYCTKNTNPTDYNFIYQQSELVVKPFDNQYYELYFNITSGTSAMSATWLLLGTSIFKAHLIQSSKERGVEFVFLPYEISLQEKQDKKIQHLSEKSSYSEEFEDIPATSEKMQKVIKLADLIAPRNIPVIIQGETGTGKEVLAKAIHNASPRKNKPFIAVNCGAISEALIDSELFGHKQGSFTGANEDRKGHFESAHGGTLFLDELGELPLNAQVKLLRVLQQKEVVRLGESKPRKIDVRIIAATHRDLHDMVQKGTFREDLFYRLAIGLIYLPSLKERDKDITYLAKKLITNINHELSDSTFVPKTLSHSALQYIQQQTWSGNVRELHNTLLRAAIWNATHHILEQEHIVEVMFKPKDTPINTYNFTPILPVNLPEKIIEIKRQYIEMALEQTKYNKLQAAKLVGLQSSQTLDNWLKNK